MASGNHSANEQMVQLITQQTIDFLATLKNDISQAKSLTEEDRKSCEAICQRANTEYNRLKMQFLKETLILIDQALNISDQQIFKKIHQAWSLQLDGVTRQCERITISLIDVMRILSKSDEQNGKKYWYFLGSAMVSFLLVGTAFGFFIAYYYPGSLVNLVGKGIFFVGVGALAATAIAANYKTVCSQECDVYTDASARLVSAKPFQSYCNERSEDLSVSELATRLKRSIATLDISEHVWQNRETLESIKKSAETQFKNLQNSE